MKDMSSNASKVEPSTESKHTDAPRYSHSEPSRNHSSESSVRRRRSKRYGKPTYVLLKLHYHLRVNGFSPV